MRKLWTIASPDWNKVSALSNQIGISPLLAHLLINRGICEPPQAERFLFSSFYDLPEPYLLKDMTEAVSLIREALHKNWKIMIFGDYDVDGITATALLYQFFISQGINPTVYLPHRVQEGYGINYSGVEIAKQKGINLFIAVDCGITAVDEIEALRREGIAVVVIDHHKPKKIYPSANAIIDPWQEGCLYPEKDLASVGLVFKLLQAVLGKDQKILNFLDLVALGTVADLADLRGENRVLVRYGLEVLNSNPRVGIKKLIQRAGLNKHIGVREISFIIAPRLNAVGRISSAHDAFRLLITQDEQEAEQLAEKLERANRRRQELEGEVFKQVRAMLESEFDFSEQKAIVIKGKEWHPGVLGIVASRLIEEYGLPAIVLSEFEGILRGSGRSVSQLDIFKTVDSCSEFLEEFGGHSLACGVSLKIENFLNFKEKFCRIAKECFLKTPFQVSLEIDKELEFSEITGQLFNDLRLLSPFGPNNPEPLFLTRRVKVIEQPRRLNRGFYRAWVKKGNHVHQVLFRKDSLEGFTSGNKYLDCVYTPVLENWEGTESITLFLRDFKYSNK
jgi:single-stranded-DNA-specific exonuclease